MASEKFWVFFGGGGGGGGELGVGNGSYLNIFFYQSIVAV